MLALTKNGVFRFMKLQFDCTGCQACSYVCYRNAITFERANNGYTYPLIDLSKCINCNMCKRPCVIYSQPVLVDAINYGMYRTNNKQTMLNSSSGGFAHDFAQASLELGFDVFGVIYDKQLKKAVHEIMTLQTLDSFSKSKYTKAINNDIYKKIHESIRLNRVIVCIGLPCENYAIKLLFSHYEKIVFVDLFCGGSLNDEYLTSYICFLENKYKNSVSNIDFRDKTYGCEILCTRAFFSNGKTKFLKGKNNLYISLLGSKYVRPSCLNCKMGFLESASDIKIGDYFGSKKRDNGTSIFLIYTKNPFLNEILCKMKEKGRFDKLDEPLSKVAVCRSKKGLQSNLMEVIESQNIFYNNFKSKSLNYAINKNIINGYTFKQKIYLILPYRIKKIIKK